MEDLLRDLYHEEITKFYQGDEEDFVISYTDIEVYDYPTADLLSAKPEQALAALRKAIWNVLPKQDKETITVRVSDYTGHHLPSLKKLNRNVVGKFVSFDGLVKRKSEIMPRIKKAVFECRGCLRLHDMYQKNENLTEPNLCTDCGGRSFRLLEEECSYFDVQNLVLQEPLETLSGKETPRLINVLLVDELTDSVLPGELLRITGVLKTKKNATSKAIHYYVEANHIEQLTKDYDDLDLTEEDIVNIKEMSQDPEVFTKIRESIVPSIRGMEEVKEALVLHLFEGTEKIFSDATRKRSSIHLLLVGDPGMGKSHLLSAIVRNAVGGIYTSGKGSSAAGLTAAAVRDENGGWNLEAGALVLGDKGHVAVDEFDKMRVEDRSALHEAMEQQQVSISKAGITATLNSRCSIMAGANPKYGRFDRRKGIGEQIDLPSTILSRFDVIFPLEDIPSPEKDSDMANHILDMHEEGELDAPYNSEELKKYIAHARQECHPRVVGEAKVLLHDFYVQMRSIVNNGEDPIPITTRQLEGLIRLTEASAKAHLREEAVADDAMRAINMMKYYLERVGLDPESGKIDVDKVEGRNPKSWTEKVQKTQHILDDLVEWYGHLPKKSITIEEISEKLFVKPKEAEKLYYEATQNLSSHEGK